MLSNEPRIYFRCAANVLQRNYLLETCKWYGLLSEYIQHVKEMHKNMYHHIRGRHKDLFKWCLPSKEDQISTGIFNYDKLHFLFKLFYDYSEKTLYFSLFDVNEDRHSVDFYYIFTLGEGRCIQFEGCVNNDLNDVDKPINNHTYKTVIPGEVLYDYINDYREFKWSLSFYSLISNS